MKKETRNKHNKEINVIDDVFYLYLFDDLLFILFYTLII